MKRFQSFFKPTIDLLRNRDAMLLPPQLILILVLVMLVVAAGIAVSSYASKAIKDNTDSARQAQATVDSAEASVADALGQKVSDAILTPQPTPSGPNAAEVAATSAAYAANVAAKAAADAQHLSATQIAEAAEKAYLLQQEKLQLEQAQATQNAAWTATVWAVTGTAVANSTAMAYPGTATAASWTQTALPFYATRQANNEMQQATLVALNVQNANDAVARQRITTPLMWFVILLSVAIVAFAAWKFSQVRKLTPDGAVNLIEAGGVKQVVSSELMTDPALTLAGRGNVMPQGASNYQAMVVDQLNRVKAIRAAALGARQEPFNVANDIMAGPQTPYLLEAGPDANAETSEYLNGKWKEAQ